MVLALVTKWCPIRTCYETLSLLFDLYYLKKKPLWVIQVDWNDQRMNVKQ